MKRVIALTGLVLLLAAGIGWFARRPVAPGGGGAPPAPDGALPADDEPDPTPVPTYAAPREGVIDEWRRAGATYETGWDPEALGTSNVPDAGGRMPVFRFRHKPGKHLGELPRPGVPFAVVTPDPIEWTADEYRRWLAGCKDQPDLRGLSLAAGWDGPDALGGVPGDLEWLGIRDSRLGPSELERLGTMTGLRSLSFQRCVCPAPLAESDLYAAIGKVSNLRFLGLNALAFKGVEKPVALRGNGLEQLRGLVRLKSVALSNWVDKFPVEQPSGNLGGLSAVPNLRSLTLVDQFYQADCLATLKPLPRCRHLWLLGTAPLPARALAAAIDAQPSLTGLHISNPNTSDELFSHLRAPERLTEFSAGNLTVSTARGKGLSRLTGLTSLTCDVRNTTDEWLAALEPLTKLRRLTLISPAITDAGLAHFKPLVNLERVALHTGYSEKLVGTGLAYLGAATNLTHLEVKSDGLTDDGLAAIGRLSGLREVAVGKWSFGNDFVARTTTAGVAELAKLPNLEALEVQIRDPFDAALAERVAKVRSLKSVTLLGATLEMGALDHFKKLRPDVDISTNKRAPRAQ